jgi:hypothetical protein
MQSTAILIKLPAKLTRVVVPTAIYGEKSRRPIKYEEIIVLPLSPVVPVISPDTSPIGAILGAKLMTKINSKILTGVLAAAAVIPALYLAIKK